MSYLEFDEQVKNISIDNQNKFMTCYTPSQELSRENRFSLTECPPKNLGHESYMIALQKNILMASAE